MIKYLLLIITVVFISCTTIRYNRQEVYLKEISRYNLKNGDTLVDIGCQTGFHDNQIAYYYPDLFFVLEDIDANNLEQIKKNNANPQFVNPMKAGYELVLGTADTIPLQQATYKKILCRKTLHEFALLGKMINEFKRVLVPGGEVIIVEINPKYPGQKYHDCVRPFLNKAQIIQLFVKEGFQVKSADSYKAKSADLQDGNIIVFIK